MRAWTCAIATAAALAASGAAADIRGIARVLDGDTIEVDGRVIALTGIDAPELNQPFGRRAARVLQRRVGGRPVRVERDVHSDGKPRAGVVYNGGVNINRWLVMGGYAWVDRRCATDPTLTVLARRARQAPRGLWRRDDPVPPWRWRADGRPGRSPGDAGPARAGVAPLSRWTRPDAAPSAPDPSRAARTPPPC